MVLLKNEGGTLPLDPAKLTSIAVIGENAVRLQAHGGRQLRDQGLLRDHPARGYPAPRGRPCERHLFGRATGRMPRRRSCERAVQAAKAADVAIVVGGLNHDRTFDCEGADRKDMKLPYGQDDLIRQVVQANPRTIVVLVSGSPVEMDAWLDRVPAVVQAWYGGMEGGNALARILFGDVNPSGKLPCTFPERLEDTPATPATRRLSGRKRHRFAMTKGCSSATAGMTRRPSSRSFPSGFGLSYTTFAYSNLKLVASADPNGPVVTVQFDVANTGAREGGEVAQVYVHQAQPSLPRPLKELKGFQKVFLKPGEKQTVSIPLERSAFAFYDPGKRGWLAEKGEFTILVGSSSRDLRLKGTFTFGPDDFREMTAITATSS